MSDITEHHELPLPQPGNDLGVDVLRLRAALQAIDSLLNTVGGTLTGLALALSGKLDASAAMNFATSDQGEKADSALQFAGVLPVHRNAFSDTITSIRIATGITAGFVMPIVKILLTDQDGYSSHQEINLAWYFTNPGDNPAVHNARGWSSGTTTPPTVKIGIDDGKFVIHLEFPSGAYIPRVLVQHYSMPGIYAPPLAQLQTGWTSVHDTPAPEGSVTVSLRRHPLLSELGSAAFLAAVANVSDNTADRLLKTGSGGWLGAALNMGAGSADTRPTGSISYFTGTHAAAVAQGLPDLGIDGATSVHWEIFTFGLATRTVQIAVQVFEVDGDRGQARLRVKHDSTWHGWTSIGAVAEETDIDAPEQVYTADDQVGNNITINLDCTKYRNFCINANGTPTPSTSGSYTINLTNLPASPTKLIPIQIFARRLGRKPSVLIQASGFTTQWVAAPSSYQSGANGFDVILAYVSPLRPTILRLSLIDSGAS